MTFPKRLKTLISDWSNNLFTQKEWQKDEKRAIVQGEAGGFFVYTNEFPFDCYLKPLHPSDHSMLPRAANEKISSDIAQMLELPVPPVLLYFRNNCPNSEEQYTCISLVLYEAYLEMSLIKTIEGTARTIINSFYSQSSGIIALDTFLGHKDRNNNDGNVIYGYNSQYPSESSFVFLDYSFSLNMNNSWDKKGWANFDPLSIYEPFKKSLDINIIMDTVKRIESLPDDAIRHIVSRIPENYMPSDHKNTVIEGLLGRKLILSTVITNYLSRMN